MNLKLINKYRLKIQAFIASSKTNTPTSNQVLIHLMSLHAETQSTSGQFFESQLKSTISLASQINLKLAEDPSFDLLTFLNDQLGKVNFDKNGEFISSLIAYFYYYKNVYPNLSEYDHLKHQVIIPARLAKERVDQTYNEQQLQNLFIVGEYDDIKRAIAYFSEIPFIYIPPEKRESAIKMLLDFMKQDEYDLDELDFTGCFRILSKINIPTELQAAVVEVIINMLSVDKFYSGDLLESMCDVLGAVPVPEPMRPNAIKQLRKRLSPNGSMIKFWHALRKMGLTYQEEQDEITNALTTINGINGNADAFDDRDRDRVQTVISACNLLKSLGTTVNFPKIYDKNRVEALLKLANNGLKGWKETISTCAWQCLSRTSIHKSMLASVLDAYIAFIKSVAQNIRDMDLGFLENIALPQNRLSGVIDMLVGLNSPDEVTETPSEYFELFEIPVRRFRALKSIYVNAENKNEVRLFLQEKAPQVSNIRSLSFLLASSTPDTAELTLYLSLGEFLVPEILKMKLDLRGILSPINNSHERRLRFIDEILKLFDSSTHEMKKISRALADVSLFPAERARVTEKSFDLLMNLTTSSNSSLTQALCASIVDILYSLHKNTDFHELVAIDIRLEGILPLVHQDASCVIAARLHQFDHLLEAKRVLSKQEVLPQEVAQNVLAFM